MKYQHEIYKVREFMTKLEGFIRDTEEDTVIKERDDLRKVIDGQHKRLQEQREDYELQIDALKLKLARHGQASGQVLKLLERALPYLKELDNLEYGNDKDLTEIISGIKELQ